MATKENKKVNTIICFDWETGGLNPSKNPVMEIAMIAINTKTLENIIAYDNLVKPYDESLVYDPQALRVNGLTVSQCENEGIELEQLVADIIQVFEEANIYNSKTNKPTLIAHNVDFDRKFLQDVFKRCGKDLSEYLDGDIDNEGNFVPHCTDTEDLSKWAFGHLVESNDNFKFHSCCDRAGIQLTDGHRAMNDVIALADLMRSYILKLRSEGSTVLVENGTVTNHRVKFEW